MEAPWRLDVNVNGAAHSYVLQLDARGIGYEYAVLKPMEKVLVPTPCAYGLDLTGEALGVAFFFSDFVPGESLLRPMLAGESWAEELYVNAVSAMHSVTEDDLGAIAPKIKREPVEGVLETAYIYLKGKSLPLADAVYGQLITSMPQVPPLKFSNGDLWLDNFIIRDKKIAGIIDFQGATFSDPVYEFLLSFFVTPELQGRGIEERYCQRLGYDPSILRWYHGLEYSDTWHWVFKTSESFVHRTAQNLAANLQDWLDAS